MTDKEQTFLTREIESYARSGVGEIVIETVWTASILTLYLGSIVFLLWKAIEWFTGPLPPKVNLTDNDVIYWGAFTIWVAFALFMIGSRLKSHPRSKSRQAALEADATAGLVEEESHIVVGLKRFREPEHHGEFYLIQLADHRVRVLYDYETANMEGGGPQRPSLKFARDLTIIRYPQSGLQKHTFSGDPVRRPRAIITNSDPRLWPDDETWYDLPWGEIESRLSPVRHS
jgi:hypothetical protein